ncbi:hypothetical protein V1477_009239 [Vespula maculifrons]|uniref:Uncharacterized protein n=1 Tax=Vespula maculifrons TaxID=7453 RepID=A0ABD2CED0_VESMC
MYLLRRNELVKCREEYDRISMFIILDTNYVIASTNMKLSFYKISRGGVSIAHFPERSQAQEGRYFFWD